VGFLLPHWVSWVRERVEEGEAAEEGEAVEEGEAEGVDWAKMGGCI